MAKGEVNTQCEGPIRLDVDGAQGVYDSFAKAIVDLTFIKGALDKEPGQAFTGHVGTKNVYILNKRFSFATFNSTTTYNDVLRLSLKLGLRPISFSSTETHAVYQFQAKHGIPKIILYLQAPGQHDIKFGSDGMISHLSSLVTVAANDRPSLKFGSYSVSKQGVETLSVINNPYTVVPFGAGAKEDYHPLICGGDDSVTSLLLQTQLDVSNYAKENMAKLEEMKTDLETLVEEIRNASDAQGTSGSSLCPELSIVQGSFPVLLPNTGQRRGWPLFWANSEQRGFIETWARLQKDLSTVPQMISRTRKLLAYSNIVPQRSSPKYLVSYKFWENVGNGQFFEIMVLSCCGIFLIISCCLLLCCYRTFFRHIPLLSILRHIPCPSWSRLTDVLHALGARSGVAEAGDDDNDDDQGQGGFPMQVYSRNMVLNPLNPRRVPSNEPPGGRRGHFDIIITPRRHQE